MLVTVTTDASYHQTLNHGSYAFWAVCDNFRINKSGVFRNKCINPDDAEAMAIINALRIVLLLDRSIKKIIVNTDSLNAIALLRWDKKHIKKYISTDLAIWNHIRTAFKKLALKDINLIFRHVKAHSGVLDKRSFANEWCDGEAKRQLRKHTATLRVHEQKKLS
jgi:ribonuclease HI